ncbi:serine--tRNA ligase [Mesorhizobium sp. M7A.T.Ca.TU.009.01.3.2]|nr:serine--tRNA ligase [Mesorhizobium sp. M7A.T.Ca.TU.009.01.3.2]
MLDIKWIRDNPKALVEALVKRSWSAGEAQSMVDGLIASDEARREHVTELQTKQERRNAASKEIGNAMRSGDAALAEKLKAEVGEIKVFIQNGEARERELDKALTDALAVLPNVPFDDVPVGKDEHDNVVKHLVGKVPTRPNWVKEHFEIGEALGMMDFERAAKLSGSRFTVLKSGLARMERALGQFMLDLHTTEHGYEEVIPPLMVKDDVLFGTNQLPKFEEDLFFTPHGEGRLGLIPTAEVPLTNLVREEITAHEKLPLRYTALTPCFRSEAGSAGRDTRGMLRQHQFYKVELVSITDQESSLAEHERMTQCAEEVLKRLGLPFRTGGSLCASKVPDAQAAYESANTLNSTILAGTNFVLHSAGWLEGGLASCYEKFMMDIDQLGMTQKFSEGVDLSENGQAMDAIRQVGPGSHYLGCDHTQANFQTAFYRSNIADNNSYEQWLAEGEKTAPQRANELARRWLESYEAPHLDPSIDEALKDFIAKKKGSMPDAFT